MTEEQIVQAVRQWAMGLLALDDSQVILAVHGPVRPSWSHVSVRLMSDRSEVASSTWLDAGIRIDDRREASIDLDAYGEEAHGWLTQAMTVWGTLHPSLDALRAAGLTCGLPGGVQSRTTIVDGRYEARAGLSLTGHHCVSVVAANTGRATRIDLVAGLVETGLQITASSTEVP